MRRSQLRNALEQIVAAKNQLKTKAPDAVFDCASPFFDRRHDRLQLFLRFLELIVEI